MVTYTNACSRFGAHIPLFHTISFSVLNVSHQTVTGSTDMYVVQQQRNGVVPRITVYYTNYFEC